MSQMIFYRGAFFYKRDVFRSGIFLNGLFLAIKYFPIRDIFIWDIFQYAISTLEHASCKKSLAFLQQRKLT